MHLYRYVVVGYMHLLQQQIQCLYSSCNMSWVVVSFMLAIQCRRDSGGMLSLGPLGDPQVLARSAAVAAD